MFARTDSHIEFGRAVCVRCTAVRNMEQCTHEPPSLFSVRFNRPMLVAENDWIKCTFDDSHTRLLARSLTSFPDPCAIYDFPSIFTQTNHTNNNIKWQYKVHTVQFPTDLIFDAPVFHAE